MALLESFVSVLTRDEACPETPEFRPPRYRITRGTDGALEWDPPADSEDLAVALSYHFPVEKTLIGKMQAAMGKFLQQSKPRLKGSVAKMRDQASSGPDISRPLFKEIPGLLSFDSKSLKEVKTKRRRRIYEKSERAEVGSNRGKACTVHREKKLKCDPRKCSGNKRFHQNDSGQAEEAPSDLDILPGSADLENLAPTDKDAPNRKCATSEWPYVRRELSSTPVNAPFSSNSSVSTLGTESGAPSDSSCQLLLNEKEESPYTEHESQFMGYQPEFPTYGDSFGLSFDPSCLLSRMTDVDTRYLWKLDEFMLSVLSHSMLT